MDIRPTQANSRRVLGRREPKGACAACPSKYRYLDRSSPVEGEGDDEALSSAAFGSGTGPHLLFRHPAGCLALRTALQEHSAQPTSPPHTTASSTHMRPAVRLLQSFTIT